jgi:hypothetical protein
VSTEPWHVEPDGEEFRWTALFRRHGLEHSIQNLAGRDLHCFVRPEGPHRLTDGLIKSHSREADLGAVVHMKENREELKAATVKVQVLRNVSSGKA